MKKNCIIITFLVIFGMTMECKHKPRQELADLVLLHGKILTMDPTHPQIEALATKGDTIMAVGSNEKIEPYIGNDTKVIDLKGRLATPGLIDGHGHFMSLGESLMGIDLRHARTWEEIVGMVSDASSNAKAGWTPNAGKPTHRIAAVEILLNNILDDRPEISVLLLETILILCKESIEVMKEHPVENGALGMSGAVDSWDSRSYKSRTGQFPKAKDNR